MGDEHIRKTVGPGTKHVLVCRSWMLMTSRLHMDRWCLAVSVPSLVDAFRNSLGGMLDSMATFLDFSQSALQTRQLDPMQFYSVSLNAQRAISLYIQPAGRLNDIFHHGVLLNLLRLTILFAFVPNGDAKAFLHESQSFRNQFANLAAGVAAVLDARRAIIHSVERRAHSITDAAGELQTLTQVFVDSILS